MTQPEAEQPIEPEYHTFMNDFAKIINAFVRSSFGPDMGFMFAMFKTGESSRFNYISNCNRDDIITLMEEMLTKFKATREAQAQDAQRKP